MPEQPHGAGAVSLVRSLLTTFRPSPIVVFLLLATALKAAEFRVEFIARANGERVAGAEVCFFRAGYGPGPVEKFAAQEEFSCLPADKVIEVPAGRWVFVLRHQGKKLLSTNPAIMNVPAPGPPEDVFHQSIADMISAGVVDLRSVNAALRPDDRLALYISNEGTALLPIVIPIPRGTDSVLAPAGMPLLLLLLQHSRVLNASDAFSVAKDTHAAAAPFPKVAEDKGNVLTWIEFPPEARIPGDQWTHVASASAVLDAGGTEHKPVSPPRDGFGADGSILFFRDVPFGKHTIKLRGPFWTAAALDVEVERPGITVTTQGVVTQPAGALTVEWSVTADPISTESDCGAADKKTAKTDSGHLAAALYTCEGLQPAQSPYGIDRTKCRRAAEANSIDARGRRAAFDGVKAGSYLVAVREPGLGSRFAVATLTAGKETRSLVTFESFNVLGRVTLDGKPLQARLEFTTGSAVSGVDGYYVGSLRAKPSRLVRVIRCSDSRDLGTRMAAKPIEAGVPHDIDITSNEIRVQVADADTDRPIAKAFVVINSAVDVGDAPLFEPATSDSDGSVTLQNMPTDQKVRVCASADHYQQRCIEPFLFGDEPKRSVQVKLLSLPRSGRILANHQFSWGWLYFVGSDGAVREEVTIRGDGTFDFRYPHASPEYVVVASDLPLFVFPLGDAANETLEIPAPQIAARTIEVAIAPQTAKKDGLIAILIDGRYVPQQAQIRHQGFRGQQPMILGRGPLLVPDLAAHSIRVALGPVMAELPPKTTIPDFFLKPEYASKLVFKEVDATNRIVF